VTFHQTFDSAFDPTFGKRQRCSNFQHFHSIRPAARCFKVETSTPLLELLAAAPPTGGCEEGELGEVITYLKKSELLKLPLDWCPYV